MTVVDNKPKYRRECYIFSTAFIPTCPNCNTDLTEKQEKCEKCGTKIEWEGEIE